MNNICQKCGSELTEKAQFCKKCGTKREPRTLCFCIQCGTGLPEDVKFCPECGKAVEKRIAAKESDHSSNAAHFAIPVNLDKPIEQLNPVDEKKETITEAQNADASIVAVPAQEEKIDTDYTTKKQEIQKTTTTLKIIGIEKLLNTLHAPEQGDISFDYTPPAVTEVPGFNDGPIKVLLDGIIRIFKGIGGVAKDRRKLISAIILAVVWLSLALFPVLGIRFSGDKFLSWLTFAQGATRGGVAGFIGGVLGKGMFASLVTGLISQLKSGKKEKYFFSSVDKLKIFTNKQRDIGLLLTGAGSALFLYNFMTGDNSLTNSMVGIAACVATIKSMYTRSGFLRRFLSAFVKKTGRSNETLSIHISRYTAGLSLGFGAGIPLSLTRISWICYALGLFIIAVGIILRVTGSSGASKEAVV